jgi:hypothetical protein
MRPGQGEKGMFQRVVWPCELIFYILVVPKCY